MRSRPDHERRRALEAFRPDVVVLQDGINEVFDRRLPAWQSWRRPGDPQFDSWLVDEYRAAAQRWDATLLLTNAPCADWPRYTQFDELQDPELRVSALNLGVYNRVTGAQLADLHQRLCPGGRYQDEVEGVPDGRPDGFHLSDEAATALARNWLGPLVLEAGRQPRAPLAPGQKRS